MGVSVQLCVSEARGGMQSSPTCLHASMRKDWPVALSFALQLPVMQFTASAMKFGWWHAHAKFLEEMGGV